MDRLKFRVWNKELKRWLTPDEWLLNFNGKLQFVHYYSGFDGDVTEADESLYTIQQWTGLKDINGDDIYEGDILHINVTGTLLIFSTGNYSAVVVWSENNLGYCLHILGKDIRKFNGSLYKDNGRIYKVIGNVFQNPELAK